MSPNHLQRTQMDRIIQRLIEGRHLNQDRELILEVVKDLSVQKMDCGTLACTDLQLLLPSSGEVAVFDTMKVLGANTVTTILS